MEIKYLAIRDIGPYRGLHMFDFNSLEGKNGFAIFSKNGRGKTTLFNATKWALFGKVHERNTIIDGRRVTGKKRPIVGEADSQLMNQSAYEEDNRPEMSVTIIAKDETGGDIQISRTAKPKFGSLPRNDDDIKTELVVEYGGNTASGNMAQELIEKFFPSELVRFFFLDGESLDEYVNLVKNSQVGGIREEVESALRIPGMTRGFSDLKVILNDLEKKERKIRKDSASSEANIQKANKRRKILDSRKIKHNKEVKKRDAERIKLEEIESFLSENEEASNHMAKIRDYKSKLDGLDISLNRSSESRVSAAKNAWKSLMWIKAGNIHEEINQKIKDAQNSEFQEDRLKKEVEELSLELKNWSGICSHCNQPIENSDNQKERINDKINKRKLEIKELRKQSPISQNQLAIALGDLGKLNPPHGTKELISDANRNWIEDRITIRNIKEKISKLEDNKLSGVNENKINDLWEKKGNLVISIRILNSSISERERDIELEEQEIAKLSNGSDGDKNHKIFSQIEVVKMLMKTIDETIDKFTESARIEVENRASETFVKIINAPEALTGVIVDRNFRAKIKGANGKPITAPSSLSLIHI